MIPFNRPWFTGRECELLLDAHRRGHLSGDGYYTKACHASLERIFGVPRALLTHSCTAALELAALLLDLAPGDEVIMPSYTFVSTANAFVLRGAVPVFVDIRADTLNLDETLVEAAITDRTRAVVAVHYAGVPCEMDALADICTRRGLVLIEDAAQAFGSTYRGRAAGSLSSLASLSFHETKNISSGEGGALLVSDARYLDRAEILREKGTNRARFFRGEVDKYTWVDLGSSFLPGDATAALLFAQLECWQEINAARSAVWRRYHEAFADLERDGVVRRPRIPDHVAHNAHIYHLLLADGARRDAFIARMRAAGVMCVFHYVPLHSAEAGRRFGRAHGDCAITTELSERLVRLPLFRGVEALQDEIIAKARAALGER